MNDADLYVYRARLTAPPHVGDAVYDGDTWWLRIDYGFDGGFRDRFRAGSFDAAELSSRSASEFEKRIGKEAKDVAEAWFALGPFLVRTFKASEQHDVDDRGKYGRWLADPFRDDDDHLSTLLVERGLATIWPTRWHEVHDPGRDKA